MSPPPRICSRCGGCVVDAPTAVRLAPPPPAETRDASLCADCADLLSDFLRGQPAPTFAALLCPLHP